MYVCVCPAVYVCVCMCVTITTREKFEFFFFFNLSRISQQKHASNSKQRLTVRFLPSCHPAVKVCEFNFWRLRTAHLRQRNGSMTKMYRAKWKEWAGQGNNGNGDGKTVGPVWRTLVSRRQHKLKYGRHGLVQEIHWQWLSGARWSSISQVSGAQGKCTSHSVICITHTPTRTHTHSATSPADGALDTDALSNQAKGASIGNCPAPGALLLAKWILSERCLWLCQLLSACQARICAGSAAAAHLCHGLLHGLGLRQQATSHTGWVHAASECVFPLYRFFSVWARIAEANMIMEHEQELLNWPGGLPTVASIDEARVEIEMEKKMHPHHM